MSSRREFLKMSAVGIGGLIVGGAAGWELKPSGGGKVTPSPSKKGLKAGWIYVGPISDNGWTMMHNLGRETVAKKFKWLDTTYAETVPESEASSYIDNMFENGCDIVFTTSWGYMVDTVKAGEKWPDKILYHCSGGPLPYKQITHKEFKSRNVGFYFNDFYQIYYLNGLMAGALTKTNKLGYVAAFTTSEVVRHLDAFFLGAKEVNPNVTMKVLVTGSWVDPETDAMNAEALIRWGADVIAFTADAPAVISTCQKHYKETGKRIYTFSHYGPMKKFGPDVVVSGQLVHWEKWYEDLLLKARSSVAEPWQHWGLAYGGYVELGDDWNEMINPVFVDKLKAVVVKDPILGEKSVYDLILYRYKQFRSEPVSYHVFKGPIYNSNEELKLKSGEIISQDELRWGMNWYIKNIIPPKK